MVITTEEGFAWERLPNESEQAWEAFLMYLTTPPPRNKLEIAKELGKHANQLYEWSKKHNWNERVRLYDSYKIAEKTASEIQLTSEVRADLEKEAVKDEVEDYRRLRELFSALLDRTEEQLVSPEVDENGDKKEITIRDISSLIQMRKNLDDLIRRAGGMPLTYKETEKESEVNEYIISLEGSPIPVKEENKEAVQAALTWGRDNNDDDENNENDD